MPDTLVMRRATQADAGALLRVAVLDDADPLRGDVLLAEVGGELWAAVELDGGRAVADPFRPSADAVELLRFRAARLGRVERAPAGRRRLPLGLRAA